LGKSIIVIYALPCFLFLLFLFLWQLADARRTRGARVDDGTAQRDRSLYEILKENKDKRDVEFNERFKHRPPKALDEDETEFLDKLEMSRREYEQQMADEEAQQLQIFQAAVASQSTIVHELKEAPPVPKVQEQKLIGRKNPPARPSSMIIKVKPQAKKAKTDMAKLEESLDVVKPPHVDPEKPLNLVKIPNDGCGQSHVIGNNALVSYSVESDDDD
ncbi:LOW QUALITY PROTEIN: PSME3-interacting protein, partial [Camellia sinensis]|uniref:LOW QUALITY PROTEIN: PSME3-interacting protein n=1 Tax=Camellia sinensis TaxID=4442 RepID=UPI001035D212